MKLTILGIITIAAAIAFAQQAGSAQAPADSVKVRGCLAGNGSDASPWVLRGAVLPAPPAAAPAGGGRGAGAPGGGAAGGGRGGAAGGGARGGDAGRGAAPAAPAAPAPAPAQPPVDLKLSGVDMTPWRNMFVEIEGTLGPRPASGLRELQVNAARSAYGDCR